MSEIAALREENVRLKQLAKSLSDTLLQVRPLGGSEMFQKVCNEYYADPVECLRVIEHTRDSLHEAFKSKVRIERSAEVMRKALEPVGQLEMWTESADDDEICLLSVGTVRRMRAAFAVSERDGGPPMKDLIERLEAATGPDRELDAAIALKSGYKVCLVGNDVWLDVGFEGPDGRGKLNPPAYTQSIDAALTLVPEGWAWSVGSCCVSDDAWVAPDYNSPTHGERLRVELGPPVRGSWTDDGFDIAIGPATNNPAIALCIAAFKARLAVSSPHAEADR